MAEGDPGTATLEHTPTWAVAAVGFVLISLSIVIEHCFHLVAKYFDKKRKKSLIQALDKIKSELMLLGFISLLLTVCEKRIAKICIAQSVGETFLPCSSLEGGSEEETKCQEQGKLSLMSRAGVQELQLLIFALAFFHVLSSFLTFSLGMAKMKRWDSWEAETATLDYEFSNDPRRFQLIHQTSFGRRHLRFWSENRYLRLPACFLRQFYGSVSKVDYFTLRHGFIMAHFAQGSRFDFQKYLKRALEKDFGVVVGVSLWIWMFSMLFIFLNAHVFYNYYWLPFIPLVMLLVVGTKLQGIITKMCLDSSDKSHVVRGTLLVRPSDHFFWFGRPRLLLHLMHFILFQNSFQLAFFTWSWYKFGFQSCFHHKTDDIVIKLAMGFFIHFLCGYVTLPLYALITQMGTSMGKAVFTGGVVKGLKRWRVKARKNIALRDTKYWTQPSVDASLDTSFGTSPSFSTLDASFSLDLDNTYDDHVFEDEEMGDKDSNDISRRLPDHEQHLKSGSFQGFDLNKL